MISKKDEMVCWCGRDLSKSEGCRERGTIQCPGCDEETTFKTSWGVVWIEKEGVLENDN